MATGKKAFDGKTPTSVIASILKEDPPAMSALQPLTPPALDHVARKCLAKDPEDRWQTARDLCHELTWIRESISTRRAETSPVRTADSEPPVVEAPEAAKTSFPEIKPAPPVWRRAAAFALVALVAALAAGLAVWTLKPTPPRPVTRTVIVLPPGDRLASNALLPVALSPDGTHLVYVAQRGETRQLYLRAMDSLEARPLSGTEGADLPFFSPDGQWVGFVGGGKLKKVPISGGAVLTLSDVSAARGAGWGTNDRIVFAPTVSSPLFQVSAAGGTPEALTKLDDSKGEVTHRWPEFLPGSKAVLFTTRSSSSKEQILVQRLDTGERKVLVEGGSAAHYVPTGHLVYYLAGNILAVPFDPERLEVTGSSVPIVEGVMAGLIGGPAGIFGFSSNGSLVYVPGGAEAARRTLVWVDRKGVAQPLSAPPRRYEHPRLSPDGQRLALVVREENPDIWTFELARGTLTRLTFDPGEDETPVWMPDGKRLAFGGDRAGVRKLLSKPADGSGTEEELLATRGGHRHANSWSPDGQFLVFGEASSGTGDDIWVLSLKADRKPSPFLRTPFSEQHAALSPDGRWMAYMSNESGRNEIYVQPYPGPGGKWQISTEGGVEPVWARNGRELFYRNSDKMMAVEIRAEPAFSASTPRVLFEGQYENLPWAANYDVSPDGQRFLMVKPNEQEQSATQINVVLNWFEELKRRVPAGR